ncbi:MAG: hypothetical protein AAF802_16910 [Planctomycetota bacterium]
MKRFRKFRLVTLLLVVAAAACLLAALVEQSSVVGQSSTSSPDGDWCLNLRLVEHSTLFSSRKVLDADIQHRANEKWNVHTSIPMDDADALMISNQHPDHPILWSADSATVTYWINDQFEDSIRIQVDETSHTFQRRLLSTTITTPSDL